MIEWIKENSIVIASASTVTTMLFTLAYLITTLRLVHTPYNFFLKPIRLSSTPKALKFIFEIENLGHSNAINVKVRYKYLDEISDLNRKNIHLFSRWVFTDETIEIKANDKSITYLNGIMTYNDIFQILGTTMTGKKLRFYYYYINSIQQNFRPATFFEIQKFRFLILLYRIKSPFIYLNYEMVYNRRQFRKEILGVLLSKGELSIDLIADEFKNRNDEQVKREIEKLLKDEYVREVEGIYFEITNKGKKFRGVFGEGL